MVGLDRVAELIADLVGVGVADRVAGLVDGSGFRGGPAAAGREQDQQGGERREEMAEGVSWVPHGGGTTLPAVWFPAGDPAADGR